MSDTQTPDPFDSYMAARLGKPVAQITAALDADETDPFDGPAHITPEREAQAHADLIAKLPPARTEAIISEARTRPALDGQPVSDAAADFMRNAKARNARSQAEKDASRRASAERVFAFIDAANRP